MRRRRKDDKRVLKSRYNPPPHKRGRRNQNRYGQPRKPRKTSKTTLFLIILVLVAFVVGAAIGVSMALGVFDDNNETHFENVTVEMTTNLNDVNQTEFDYDVDQIDYNDKQDIKEYNLTSTGSIDSNGTMGY